MSVVTCVGRQRLASVAPTRSVAAGSPWRPDGHTATLQQRQLIGADRVASSAQVGKQSVAFTETRVRTGCDVGRPTFSCLFILRFFSDVSSSSD
jgi:hypothetical protein